MKKRNIPGRLAAATLMAVLAAMPVYAKEAVIPEGIFVGDLNLGGMTEEEAAKAVGDYVGGLADRKVTLDVDGATADTTAAELGYAWSNQEAVKEAVDQASGGNLIQQYMGLMDLKKEPVRLPLEAGVAEEKVKAFVDEKCGGLAGEPQNASITRVDGQFQITPGAPGKVVDITATAESLDEALADPSGGPVAVKAAVSAKEPDITEEDLATIGDVLGTFSTDFSSSGAARSKNLANGAAKINGHLLMPGETLSGYECMHPFTTENGYYTAAAYENGMVVDSVGGGVCQIATTLYNASLRAELEITQRQNHSMIVTYVKPSMDAAIAGTYKDIKVTNNYSTPIYVEGGVSGRTLTFTFYGKETRPANRKVEYVSETLSVMDPGAPERRVDPSMSPGASKRVQSAHRGMKSRLWKVVTVDGVETERTILHTDTYNPSKAIILTGPSSAPAANPAAPAPVPADQTQPAQGDSQQPQETEPAVVEGINGGPGVTAPALKPTEAPAPAPADTAPAPAPTEAPAAAPAPAEAPAPAPTEAPAPAPTEAPAPAPTEAPAAAPTEAPAPAPEAPPAA